MSEIWKDVVGYEGIYSVSDQGRVKRILGGCGAVVGKILVSTIANNGYPTVGLCFNGINKYRSIHRLVLEAFVGPCQLGMECCHLDGNPKNNYLNNLEWDTRLKNQQDRVLHKTSTRGSQNGMSKLTETNVIEIKRLLTEGCLAQKEIGKFFNITGKAISDIYLGKTWKHV